MIYRGEVRDSEALGQMLQQGRLINGLTQREIAEHIGGSQRDVWAVESGKPSIQMTRLFEMLRASGVRLYAEIEEPEPNSSQATDG